MKEKDLKHLYEAKCSLPKERDIPGDESKTFQEPGEKGKTVISFKRNEKGGDHISIRHKE